jgi:hypothetical protein
MPSLALKRNAFLIDAMQQFQHVIFSLKIAALPVWWCYRRGGLR